MSARLLIANVLSFGLQVAVLAAAAALLARAFQLDRSRRSRIVLAYWRTLLLVCLALPFCQPWNIIVPPAVETTPLMTLTSAAPATLHAGAPVSPRPAAWPTATIAIAVLSAGMGLRLAWLMLGALSLRRLRRDARPLDPLPASVHQAQERLGVPAALFTSDRIAGPVTFGWRRPVVLFPPGVASMPPHVQEAITYHELLHVRRRDWLSELFEEAVRTILWFHPAIWWLVGRIRLAREQVVDQAAVELTASKERYVDALLAVARSTRPSTFVPVSPFFRRHLLKRRVARILQESPMTTARLFASLTASAAALTCAAVYAVSSFPLEAQGRAPAELNKEPIQIVNGSEHLLHGATPAYPRRAIEQKVEGDVVVDMTLNERGEVSDARVLSGPDELRKPALEAVLQWHYAPSALSSTSTQATLRFQIPPEGLEIVELAEKRHVVPDGRARLHESWEIVPDPIELDRMKMKMKGEFDEELAKQAVELKRAEVAEIKEVIGHKERFEVELARDASLFEIKLFTEADRFKRNFASMPKLVDVRTERVGEAMARELLAQAGVAIGDPISEDTAKRIETTARSLDEHVRVEFADGKGGIVLILMTK